MFGLFTFEQGGWRVAVSLLGLGFAAYLGYHAFIGDRGVATHMRLAGEAERLEHKLAELTARRQRMEQRIALLSDKSINRDMLDERVRSVLNFAHPDEITILRSSR